MPGRLELKHISLITARTLPSCLELFNSELPQFHHCVHQSARLNASALLCSAASTHTLPTEDPSSLSQAKTLPSSPVILVNLKAIRFSRDTRKRSFLCESGLRLHALESRLRGSLCTMCHLAKSLHPAFCPPNSPTLYRHRTCSLSMNLIRTESGRAKLSSPSMDSLPTGTTL